MSDVLSPNQRRTERARQSFSEKFSTPEDRSEFYRSIGQRGNTGRITLAPDEASALSEAYRLLRSISAKIDKSPDEDAG